MTWNWHLIFFSLPSCLFLTHLWAGLPWPACVCTKPSARLTCRTLSHTPPINQQWGKKLMKSTKWCQLFDVKKIPHTFVLRSQLSPHVECMKTKKQSDRYISPKKLGTKLSKFQWKLTFSGSWASTSFLSRRSKKGLSTLCKRRMIRMVSSSFRSTLRKKKRSEIFADICRTKNILLQLIVLWRSIWKYRYVCFSILHPTRP